MRDHLIKSTLFFQDLLCSCFQCIKRQVIETLLLLCVCHLFGLYNPNQVVSDALELPKARLYRDIGALSLYHARCLNLRLGCAMAADFIKNVESKSASTQSRRRMTVSVDDTNLPRDGETLSYCSKWWSKKHKTSIWCQNVLGIALKVGDRVIPLDTRLVSKQGRGNTDKPSLVIAMLTDVLDFFDTQGVDLRKYPITFDRKKIRTLLVFGKPLRTCEALRIWSQHHGIEQYWRYLKSSLHVSDMSLESREGAYVSLGIKVMSYLMLLQVSIAERRTFHQIQLQLTGERQMLMEFITHFHKPNPKEP